VKLADGGIYDNQGLQRVVGKCRTVLISDGGSPFDRQENPSNFWPLLLMRTLFIMDSQVHALRRRIAFGADSHCVLWSIDKGPDAAMAEQMAAVGTQLRPFDPGINEKLLQWGAACCSHALDRAPGQLSLREAASMS
jgi:NTE family protein